MMHRPLVPMYLGFSSGSNGDYVEIKGNKALIIPLPVFHNKLAHDVAYFVVFIIFTDVQCSVACKRNMKKRIQSHLWQNSLSKIESFPSFAQKYASYTPN